MISNVSNSSKWDSEWAPGSVWREPWGAGNFGQMTAGWAAGGEQLQEGDYFNGGLNLKLYFCTELFKLTWPWLNSIPRYMLPAYALSSDAQEMGD